jgi:glycosyltransferase involved in cell wall biosynthesis
VSSMPDDLASRSSHIPTLVSVIVPVYNAQETLDAQLDALSRQDYRGDWELVLADNGSDDDSFRDIARWRAVLPRLQVVDASTRKGAAHARNTGASVAGGDLLAFCDADDIVGTSWLRYLVRSASSFDLVQGRIDERTLNEGQTRPLWPDSRLPVALGFLPFAVAANCAIWRQAFESAGGFPENPSPGEDVALSFRIQLAGFTIGYDSEAVVRYRYRPRLWDRAKQYYAWGQSEALLYRQFRRYGVVRAPLWAVARKWLALAARLPSLLEQDHRGTWVRQAAYYTGMARGSLRHRVLYL